MHRANWLRPFVVVAAVLVGMWLLGAPLAEAVAPPPATYTDPLGDASGGAPDLAQVTGGFFSNGRRVRPSRRSEDRADAERLWRVSAALVGMDASATTGGP